MHRFYHTGRPFLLLATAQPVDFSVTSRLIGANFSGRDALTPGDEESRPFVQLDQAARIAPEIQFLEQAFEWENMTYVLYPYFWAAEMRWGDLADIQGADDEFVRFLRSGSARIVVPARPGFEQQVQLYVDLGMIWGGGSVPAPDDPEYVSVVEEIKAQQRALSDGKRGESWEVRLPTTLVWLDSSDALPANPRPELDVPPGQV